MMSPARILRSSRLQVDLDPPVERRVGAVHADERGQARHGRILRMARATLLPLGHRGKRHGRSASEMPRMTPVS
jgi:hypothetical protein